MTTRIGAECPKCGGTTRYIADNRCAPCRLASGQLSYEKRRAAKDDERAGLPTGFVRFGTMAHFILLRAHEEKFVSNTSIRVRLQTGSHRFDMSPNAVASNLQRLVKYKFLYKVGRGREYGQRSYNLFSINYRDGNGFLPYKNLTPNQRTKDYRARKKTKVNSVFNWRGSYESELPK